MIPPWFKPASSLPWLIQQPPDCSPCFYSWPLPHYLLLKQAIWFSQNSAIQLPVSFETFFKSFIYPQGIQGLPRLSKGSHFLLYFNPRHSNHAGILKAQGAPQGMGTSTGDAVLSLCQWGCPQVPKWKYHSCPLSFSASILASLFSTCLVLSDKLYFFHFFKKLLYCLLYPTRM